MITDAQFRAWAQSSTKYPVLLVEITHKDGKVYLSDHVYSTNAGETPEHISYDVCLKQTVLVERTLDADSLVAVRVYNDGSLDHWLDFLFTGYDIEIFMGDNSWPRQDFKRQFWGTVDSFTQISPISFEFKSTLATTVIQTDIFNVNSMRIAGDHTTAPPIRSGFLTHTGSAYMYQIAMDAQFDRSSVVITNNGYVIDITWDDTPPNSRFYLTNYERTTLPYTLYAQVDAYEKKLKGLFADICTEYGQAFNAENLADYPIDPDITYYTNSSITFPEFLTVTLETLGAVLWINDEGEIEFYRKELPTELDDDTVTSWITPQDSPEIKAITEEYPVSVVATHNRQNTHNELGSPFYEYNVLDLDYPSRILVNKSYAESSYAQSESRRLADLLAVTRRTYSVQINRISPELFIGAIVNIYSPKDRWNNGTEGLNALVVGFTQSFTKNTSELIVWR
jgi:hypothetical protein